MKNKILLFVCLALMSCNNTNEEISMKEEVNSVSFDENYRENEYVKFVGKTALIDNKVVFYQSNTYLEVNFKGTDLIISMSSTNDSYMCAFIDNETDPTKVNKILVKPDSKEFVLAKNLEDKEHTIKLMKITDDDFGSIYINNIKTSGELLKKPNYSNIKLEYIGDSITCASGIEGNSEYDSETKEIENASKSYAYYASNYLHCDFQVTCKRGYGIYCGWSDSVKNGMKASLLSSFKSCSFNSNAPTWNNNLYIPDIVVINAGTNDGAMYANKAADKKAFIDGFINNYCLLIDDILNTYGNKTIIVLSHGMMSDSFALKDTIQEVANKYPNNCYYYEFDSLAKVGGVMPAYHPNEAMHKYAGESLGKFIVSIYE